MGFSFRKSFTIGKGRRINVSRSGISASQRAGRVSITSRGRLSVRLIRSLTWRSK